MSFDDAELFKERADAFLRNAEKLVAEGVFDLAAFNIEQYCQLMLKYKLLIKTGTYPMIHSPIRLLRELLRMSPSLRAFLDNPENMLYLTKLEDAYIGSRYLPRRYEESEVRKMLEFVKGRSRPLSRGFEVYVESSADVLRQLNNYREVAREVKSMVNAVWSDAKVYVFGSVTKGKQTAASDIDILIVVDGVTQEQAYLTEAKIYSAIDAPIELHVATPKEFVNWYTRFIDKLEEIQS
jgi:HEPN domain-containing protein/predicted nucleotidyltransferase